MKNRLISASSGRAEGAFRFKPEEKSPTIRFTGHQRLTACLFPNLNVHGPVTLVGRDRPIVQTRN